MKKNAFTLIELLVALAILVIIIAIPLKIFVNEISNTAKQVSISSNDIVSLPFIEIIRHDIQIAGYGLFWNPNNISYHGTSSKSTRRPYSFPPAIFNSNPPKAIDGKDDPEGEGFGYLVLRSAIYGLSRATEHFSYIANDKLNIWPTNSQANYNNFNSRDDVIIFNVNNRTLQTTGSGLFYWQWQISQNANVKDTNPSNYGLPNLPWGTYMVYGIDNSEILRAPFNRIDYRLYSSANVDSDCAKGTYTLGRAIMRQKDGVMYSYPILNCVADFEVYFGLDTNNKGFINSWSNDITSLNAQDVRNELKEVVVYILIQEGNYDKNYTYPYKNVFIGDTVNGQTYGRIFNIASDIPNYQHYRWKLIKVVAVPKNLE